MNAVLSTTPAYPTPPRAQPEPLSWEARKQARGAVRQKHGEAAYDSAGAVVIVPDQDVGTQEEKAVDDPPYQTWEMRRAYRRLLRDNQNNTGFNSGNNLEYCLVPHNSAPEIDVKSRVFTEADITDLLKRHGVSDEDRHQELRRLFTDVDPAATIYAAGNAFASAATPLTGDVPEEAQDTPLARLSFRYEKRLREIILPKEGFRNDEQAKEAGRLCATYLNLRKLQEKLGLPVTPQDPRVAQADRMRVAYRRRHAARAPAA